MLIVCRAQLSPPYPKYKVFHGIAYWEILHAFLSSADFCFKINFFEKFFQEFHQRVKQFESRSGPTLCRA